MKKFIQKTKQTIVLIIKYLTVAALLFVIIYGTLMYLDWKQEEMIYIAPETPEMPQEAPLPTKSDVELAEDMLAEATAKLDAEEAKLVAEIKAIEAESTAKILEREAKIAEINEIRASF